MAHQLSIRKDGTVEAAFGGMGLPWHQLGRILNKRMTLKEAIREARTEWNVSTQPLFYKDLDGNFIEVPDKKHTRRDDTGEYFGTVGLSYTPIQQPEQANFLEALVGEGAVVEAHGALFGGKQVFWTVKVPEDIVIDGKDRIQSYMILANGHDGSLSFKVFWSPIRVVCNNTLMASLAHAKDGISIRHTKNVMDRVKEAQRLLGLAGEFYKTLAESAKEMKDVKVSDQMFEKNFLELLVPIPEDDKKHGRLDNVRDQIRTNFRQGTGADLAGRTAWGAYNAATLYTSHQMGGSRNSKTDAPSKRFDSIFFGSGRDMSMKAFDLACSLVPNMN